MLTSPNIESLELILGRYRLLAKLGSGGMGDVYLGAEQSRLVVVKVLRNTGDPQHVAMFLDEARIASKLVHPNIVRTFEVGQQGNLRLMVMEYLHGPTLSWLRKASAPTGGLPEVVEIEIICNVLEGLHHAHEATTVDGRPLQLVHRDLSPDNVIVTYQGDCKILDFGIAKVADSINQTQQGFFKGKLKNMPPEQLRGHAVDRRTDIFSAGVLLWEGVSGRPLWGDLGNAAVALRLSHGELPPLAELGPHVPHQLRQICECAMSVDPARRFATAKDMQRALLEYTAPLGHPVGRLQLAHLVEPLWRQQREKIERLVRMAPVLKTEALPVLNDTAAAQDGEPTLNESMPDSPVPAAPAPRPTAARTLPASRVFPTAAPVPPHPPASPATYRELPRQKASIWRWLIPAAIVVSCAAAALAIWVSTLEPSPVTVEAPPAPAPAPPPPAPTSDEIANRHLDAAERLIASKDYPPAAALLARAEAIEGTSLTVDARIARVRVGVEDGQSLQAAHQHLAAERWKAAGDAARRVLDRTPDHSEALQIIATAKVGRARSRPAGARTARPAPQATPELTFQPEEPPPAEPPPAPVTMPAPAPPAPVPPPPTPVAPPPAAAARPRGPVYATPARAVLKPTLPRVVVPQDELALGRVCAQVEAAVISLGGLSADYVRGITAPMRRQVGVGAEIYPVAMYYFIIREAGLGKDNATAAATLAASYRDGVIHRFKNLPATEGAR